MIIAKVQGHATSTVKHRSMGGQKLLVCLQLDMKGKPGGDVLLAIDRLGAGVGQTVMLSSDGKAVTEMLSDTTTPVRWFTLGLIDEGQTIGAK